MSKELIEDLRHLAKQASWASEPMSNAAAALESQAREIASKQATIDGMNEAHWKVVQELAALKAQSGGVVLPERLTYSQGVMDYVDGWNDALDEVARLNQPASAGDERADFEAAMGASILAEQGEFALSRSHDAGRLYTFLATKWAWKAWQARAALSANHSEQVREVPSVQITGHLDEVDAPVWEFINAEARKLGPITGSIDSYGFSRPNGGQPNGGVVVLWNGPKIHAVAMAVRDAMNRTVCVRLLAAAPSAGSHGGDV